MCAHACVGVCEYISAETGYPSFSGSGSEHELKRIVRNKTVEMTLKCSL